MSTTLWRWTRRRVNFPAYFKCQCESRSYPCARLASTYRAHRRHKTTHTHKYTHSTLSSVHRFIRRVTRWHTRVCIALHVYTHAHITHIDTSTRTHTYTHVHKFSLTRTYIHIRTHAHAYLHAHTHHHQYYDECALIFHRLYLLDVNWLDILDGYLHVATSICFVFGERAPSY